MAGVLDDHLGPIEIDPPPKERLIDPSRPFQGQGEAKRELGGTLRKLEGGPELGATAQAESSVRASGSSPSSWA